MISNINRVLRTYRDLCTLVYNTELPKEYYNDLSSALSSVQNVLLECLSHPGVSIRIER